ncbi:hypothetical protein THAOC_22973 [Thalassiosira oceanica]|uniref:Glutamine amidotransferase type-2 domain-containing protein n=1 Tax=Thalassiosira oceanica TaxID=159749 RepID=K0RT50_THAOC|nr:hypothetical protein THAOC_22973 [Thalassiosira oceanica]|eukprot:EJK57028.1 hypothetical protein THAOC_22973 [Thalassiosira oceanica]
MHRQHWFGNVPTDVSGEPLATDNATATTKFHLSFRRGMNCATMTDFSFSFRGFARRGGDTDVHSHGWGLCFYDGRGLRSFHDPDPAAESLLAEFLQTHPVKTLNMVSHIRYATRGEVNLENVHPFSRELWGINFCFAHNGDVAAYDRTQFACNSTDEISFERSCPKMEQFNKECVQIPWVGLSIGADDPNERHYNPVGKTDSEAIFCAILNALRTRFDTLPTLPVLYGAIASLVNEIVALDSQYEGTTILNFLLGVGQHIQFAYSWPGARDGSSVWNGLHYLVREPPFGRAHLTDCDYTIDFGTLNLSKEDRVAVIATTPLTDDEDWVEVKRGQLILFDDGIPHLAPDDCFQPELRKHGLDSDCIPSAPNLEIDLRRYEMRRDFFQGASI